MCEDASRGGLSPEREKPGLLPERPAEDALPASDVPDGVRRARRRPADVWVPHGLGPVPAALDFACTSGLRADSMMAATTDPASILSAYEDFKSSFKPPGEDTATGEACKQAGFAFLPMIIESHGGGWAPSARRTLDAIAKHTGACWRQGTEPESLRIAQRLSCALHRETARAILRRLHQPPLPEEVGGWQP